MKKVYSILACLMMLVSFCTLTACNDDEPGDTSAVVGTWYGDDYDRFYSNVSITFYADGTGTATVDVHRTITMIGRGNFTYKVKGNKVTTKGELVKVNSDGDKDIMAFNNEYEIQGNKLIVKSGDRWYLNNLCMVSYKK